MRRLIIPLILFSTITHAQAVERLYASRMSCEQIKAVLEQDGAAIIYYPSRSIPGLNLFDRFASASNHCDTTQRIAPFAITTSDSNACKVAICRELRNGGSN